MQILKNIEVPTGNILIVQGQKAREGITWVVKRPSKVIKIKVLED